MNNQGKERPRCTQYSQQLLHVHSGLPHDDYPDYYMLIARPLELLDLGRIISPPEIICDTAIGFAPCHTPVSTERECESGLERESGHECECQEHLMLNSSKFWSLICAEWRTRGESRSHSRKKEKAIAVPASSERDLQLFPLSLSGSLLDSIKSYEGLDEM